MTKSELFPGITVTGDATVTTGVGYSITPNEDENDKFKKFAESLRKTSDYLENLGVETIPSHSYVIHPCEHEYKKTLAKSGTYFIGKCERCCKEQPWVDNDE